MTRSSATVLSQRTFFPPPIANSQYLRPIKFTHTISIDDSFFPKENWLNCKFKIKLIGISLYAWSFSYFQPSAGIQIAFAREYDYFSASIYFAISCPVCQRALSKQGFHVLFFCDALSM
jgi:hypothetical protein